MSGFRNKNVAMESRDKVNAVYNTQSVGEWADSKTMQHASGVWGRRPMLEHLRDLVKPGQTVVDLGAGAGFPTSEIVPFVGPNGRVIGLELSDAMLQEATTRYQSVHNLKFYKADITQSLPLETGSADVVTSFMVCQNLRLTELQNMLNETTRILKKGGQAVYLTLHPEIFASDWELDFMIYDPRKIAVYRDAKNKEDIEIPGRVMNVDGGWKNVWMFTHSRESMFNAIEKSGLEFVSEIDLWIDKETAEKSFGPNAVRKLPTTPIYWIITMKKHYESEN